MVILDLLFNIYREPLGETICLYRHHHKYGNDTQIYTISLSTSIQVKLLRFCSSVWRLWGSGGGRTGYSSSLTKPSHSGIWLSDLMNWNFPFLILDRVALPCLDLVDHLRFWSQLLLEEHSAAMIMGAFAYGAAVLPIPELEQYAD